MTELVLVQDPYELVRVLGLKIKDAKKDLKEHPSYPNALKLQGLKADQDETCKSLREKIKLVVDNV